MPNVPNKEDLQCFANKVLDHTKRAGSEAARLISSCLPARFWRVTGSSEEARPLHFEGPILCKNESVPAIGQLMERVESKELQLRVNLLGVGVSRVHTLFNQTDVVCMQTCLSRLAICKKKLRPIPLTPEEDREWQDSLTVCKNKKKKKDCEREVDKIVLDIAKFDVTHLKPLHYGGL